MLPNGSGGWKLQWNQDSYYLQNAVTLPMSLLPKTANTLAGPWDTATQTTDPVTKLRSCDLPAGALGFGRVEFLNPNWAMDP